MDGFSPAQIALLVAILAASALMSGLSGFGFSAVGALCLIVLPPKLGVPLLMTLSAANQVMSLRQLKADMKKVGDVMLKEWLEKAGPEGKTVVDNSASKPRG